MTTERLLELLDLFIVWAEESHDASNDTERRTQLTREFFAGQEIGMNKIIAVLMSELEN